MPATPPELLASEHPVLTGLLWTAFALYLAAFLASLARPAVARWPLWAGAAAHLVATAGRGVVIGFFPLTNKLESFSAAALSLSLVALLSFRPVRAWLVPMLVLASACMAKALSYPLDLAWPPPLMRTVWYALHVPSAFVSYALWASAAAGSLAWLKHRDPVWLERVDRWTLTGLALWSLSMICGGVWGVVAWGAYFLWDPKVVWSVILWFHFATFVHVKLAPSLCAKDWLRPALSLAGLVFVFIAYVGTSIFFPGSTHAF